MKYRLAPHTVQSAGIVAIAGIPLLFLIVHFLLPRQKIADAIARHGGTELSKIYTVVIQRLWGTLWYGIVSLAITVIFFPGMLRDYGLQAGNSRTGLLWVAVLCPVVVLINALHARREDNLQMYPQIRTAHWPKKQVAISALSWCLYLIAYEYALRGFLLFSCRHAFGSHAAIAINTGLYALIHVPKGAKEAWGAIPLGILLCVASLQTGSIAVAIAVHITMALSNEWFSIRAHKNMRII